eukprot:tig00000219_g19530.t1
MPDRACAHLARDAATVTLEVEGGPGWPAELLKDAERELRFTQSVGPAGLDLYFYDPEADTLDLRTASRKLPKLSPGCFFYVVRRDMQPAHEDGDSNTDPELVKLMKRGKAQHAAAAPAPQPVQAATSSDSAQLSSLVEVLRLQVQTSVGAVLASAGEPRAKKRAATGANYLKEDTDGKRGTGDCNTARDVVRLLWDEPIEGSGGEYTPETCPRAWLFLKKCGGGARKTHDTLRAAIPALARVHVETGAWPQKLLNAVMRGTIVCIPAPVF